MNEREQYISENLGLVHACANRFRSRGVEYDDLFQAGCVGLIKAADGFDKSRGFAFSTYAVPAILGEIKRIFRDGGAVKVSRAMKEKAMVVRKEHERLTKENGVEPTVGELSERLEMTPADVAELLLVSLPPVSLTGDDEGEEKQFDIPTEGFEAAFAEREALKACLDSLSDEDRRLLELRYFGGKTQSAVAQALGMTQVQVSRREKKLLFLLREKLAG